MRKSSKRALFVVLGLALLAAIPVAVWVSLTHRPKFYRAVVQLPRGQRELKAKHFVAQSLQLRNDICNEPTWEAVFSDQEVNAWLAEDLVTHFADQLPPEVHEPRVVFEIDRVTLAFELDQGPVRTVIWVVARPRVPEGNVLELTLEKIRAGVLPVPPENILNRIAEHGRGHGLDVHWKYDQERLPVATIRYTPDFGQGNVQLEQVQIREGQIRLAGKSNRTRGVVRATLPTRKVLQSKFPRRKVQQAPGVSIGPPSSAPDLRSSASPTS
jgi:hypothetical protein